MPRRFIPFVTGEYYHIYNRGVNKQPIFLGVKDYSRALEISEFYSYASSKPKYSKFVVLSKEERQKIMDSLWNTERRLVEIICYCLIPNHFHFLLKQTEENGISTFMRIIQNSYTRYHNTKHERIGPLLQGQFKAVRVEDENQLLHLSRYIHLNPYSSFVLKELTDLEKYPWSSFPEYLGNRKIRICSDQVILSNFKARDDYKRFVFDQAAYQRELELIKHLLIEKDFIY